MAYVIQSEIGEEQGHSLLSPSASPRWMRCPGSVWLCQQAPKRPASIFAEEGTVAHYVAAQCLRSGVSPSVFLGDKYLSPAGLEFEVTQEMADALGIYVGAVNAVAAGSNSRPLVERKFSLYDGLCDGTADAVVVGDGAVYVFDLKYGQGDEVLAEWNSQMMIYALGAVKDLGLKEDTKIVLTVVQPRHFKDEKVKTFEMHYGTLLAWEDFELIPAVEKAKDAHLHTAAYVPGEVQCKWCEAATICPAIKEQALALAPQPPAVLDSFPASVADFSPDQLAAALNLEAGFKKWVKTVSERFDEVGLRAKDRLAAGLPVPGFKLVQGRASRSWSDEAQAIAVANSVGVDPFEMKVRSPAQMEKAFKENGEPLDGLAELIKTEYGTEIVPESSKKKALPVSAEQVFSGVEAKQAPVGA